MDQLIRFQALSAELSTDELKLFVCKLIDNGQREPIISGIFNNLHKQIKHNKDLSIVQTINENIQNIIQNRNVDTNNNTSNISNKSKSKPNPISFKSLSSSIINEIGSYLWLNEIVKMERINRMFFVSLRYPYPALQKICSTGEINHKNWIEKYCKSQTGHQMPLDFKQFKSITELHIFPGQMIKTKIHTLGRLFNKIRRLTLCFGSMDTCDQILNSNICNFASIKELTLFPWLCDHSLFSATSYLKWILMSEQLKVLNLSFVTCNDITANTIKNNIITNTKEIQQKLSKLEVFVARYLKLELYKPILDIISNQIISLHITDENALINIGFPNLKEFCFKGTTNNITIAINELMKSAKHLQKIAIRFKFKSYNVNNNEQKNFAKTINNILSLNSLRMIRLDVSNDNFAKLNIINILENAVTNTNVNDGKSLEIVVIGMNINNINLSSNVLSSFVMALRIWRPYFSFTYYALLKLDQEIITKLSKFVTVETFSGGYRIYNSTKTNELYYKTKHKCNYC